MKHNSENGGSTSITQTTVKISKASQQNNVKSPKTPKKHKQAKPIKIRPEPFIVIAAVIIIVGVIFAFSDYSKNGRPKSQMNKAVSYAEAGDYTKAIKILDKMGDYENAPELMLKYQFLDETHAFILFGEGQPYHQYRLRRSDENIRLRWKKVKKSGTKYLIVSDDYLFWSDYDLNKEEVSWKDCSLRSLLHDYYKEHFTKLEKSIVLTSKNFTPYYRDSSRGYYTKDKLFLLSEEEYLDIKSVDMDSESHCYWWLRTDFKKNHESPIVYAGNVSNYKEYVKECSVFVRAAMWVDISKINVD